MCITFFASKQILLSVSWKLVFPLAICMFKHQNIPLTAVGNNILIDMTTDKRLLTISKLLVNDSIICC